MLLRFPPHACFSSRRLITAAGSALARQPIFPCPIKFPSPRRRQSAKRSFDKSARTNKFFSPPLQLLNKRTENFISSYRNSTISYPDAKPFVDGELAKLHQRWIELKDKTAKLKHSLSLAQQYFSLLDAVSSFDFFLWFSFYFYRVVTATMRRKCIFKRCTAIASELRTMLKFHFIQRRSRRATTEPIRSS